MTEESDFEPYGDDDDEEEDFVFDPVVPTNSTKKSYEVDHKPLSLDDLKQILSTETTHVSNILGCPPATAATLLRYFKWNKERLVEEYVEDSERISKDAGVVIEGKQPELVRVEDFCCDICCNDDPLLDTLALSCDHRFCIDCYENYLNMKITEEGESRHIKCPASDCKVVVDEKTVELIVKPTVLQK